MSKKWPAYCFGSMLDGSKDIEPVQVNAEVCILLLGQDLQDPPASSPALDGRVGQGLSEDSVDDLLAQQQLAALGVLDDVGDGRGSSGASLGVGTLEVLDDGQDLGLTQGSEFWIRGRLDGFDDGVLTLACVGPIAPGLAHC